MTLTALLLGGPRHLERWPVPIGPDGLPVPELLAAPRWRELLEYVAVVDPHLVDRVRARYPEVDAFLTYETEEV